MASSMATFTQQQQQKKQEQAHAQPIPVPTGMTALVPPSEDIWGRRKRMHSVMSKTPITEFDASKPQPFHVWEKYVPTWYFQNKPKTNKAGGDVVDIRPYEGADFCPRVQFGTLEKPMVSFHGSYPVDKKQQITTKNKLNMEVMLPKDSPEFNFAKLVEDKFLCMAAVHSTTWWNDDKFHDNTQIIDYNHKPFVKMPKANKKKGETVPNPKASPTMKLRIVVNIVDSVTKKVLPTQDGVTQVYLCKDIGDPEKGIKPKLVRGNYEDLMEAKAGKIMHVVPVVDFLNVWFMDGSFGVLASCPQIIIVPKPKRADDFCIEGGYDIVSMDDESTNGPNPSVNPPVDQQNGGNPAMQNNVPGPINPKGELTDVDMRDGAIADNEN